MAGSKKLIVCIEDEPEMTDLIRVILGRTDHEFVGAAGRREGLEGVRKLHPDLARFDVAGC
jgi:CheY-like chemotaxis protein